MLYIIWVISGCLRHFICHLFVIFTLNFTHTTNISQNFLEFLLPSWISWRKNSLVMKLQQHTKQQGNLVVCTTFSFFFFFSWRRQLKGTHRKKKIYLFIFILYICQRYKKWLTICLTYFLVIKAWVQYSKSGGSLGWWIPSLNIYNIIMSNVYIMLTYT